MMSSPSGGGRTFLGSRGRRLRTITKSISWFALLALVMGAGPDPASLVSQLGSMQPPEREAAATALEAIGPGALPALRAARDGRDLEFQGRATALIRKIEGDQLVRPTMVTLDFQNRPMSEVIREISTKTGCKLRIYELRKEWLAERITLHEPAAVPFWKAIDRLCEAGRFQYNLGSASGGACVSFFRGEISGPASDHAVFRVQLEEIVYHGRLRPLHLGRDHSSRPIFREDDRDKSYIKLRVMVEPRMLIRNKGSLKGLVVTDDLGQSLLPANPEDEQPDHDFGFTPGAYVLGQVPLKLVDRPGKVIRKLRGVAPVAVAAHRPDPLVIPLTDTTGRSYRSEQSILMIRAVRKIVLNRKVTVEAVGPGGEQGKPEPTPPATEIELTVRRIDRPGVFSPGPDLSEHQFEVLDADGKVWEPSPWWLSDSGPQRQDGETRVLLTPVDGNLSPWAGDLAGAKLRYYDMTVVERNVPFEFADVTLP